MLIKREKHSVPLTLQSCLSLSQTIKPMAGHSDQQQFLQGLSHPCCFGCWGVEPRTFCVQSSHWTMPLHPQVLLNHSQLARPIKTSCKCCLMFTTYKVRKSDADNNLRQWFPNFFRKNFSLDLCGHWPRPPIRQLYRTADSLRVFHSSPGSHDSHFRNHWSKRKASLADTFAITGWKTSFMLFLRENFHLCKIGFKTKYFWTN